MNDSCIDVSALSSKLEYHDMLYLLVHIQLPEDLSRVQKVCVLIYPVVRQQLLSGSFITASYLFAFHAVSGRFSTNATQYPLIRKRNVRRPWTAASGIMYVLSRLQRSIGLM